MADSRYSFDFDIDRNEQELGSGFVIYKAPLALTGGIQANIDASQANIAPNIVTAIKSLPDWVFYAVLAVAVLYFLTRNES